MNPIDEDVDEPDTWVCDGCGAEVRWDDDDARGSRAAPHRRTATGDRGRYRAMEYFTTWGPVRACCGHMHRTAGAAHRCATRDDARAKLQGRDCYSDRRARRVSSREELRGYDVTQGPGEPLATMDEEAQP